MKLITKFCTAFFLLASTWFYAQCTTTVTISDASAPHTVFQTIVNGGPNGTVIDGCIPSPEPVLRIRISSTCNDCNWAHFDGTAIHGGSATVIPGTEEYLDGVLVEFQVNNPTGAPFILWGTQGNCNHLKVAVTYCGPGEEPGGGTICMTCVDCPNCPVITDPCLSYEFIKCCDLNCIRFKLKDKKCTGCYLVSVLLEDGSIETIDMNLNDSETTMTCFNKKIIRVLSISRFYCPDNCPPETRNRGTIEKNSGSAYTALPQIKDRIKIAPNPTKTVLNFEGEQLSDYSLTLFDAQGKQVLHQDQITNPVNLEKLAKGTYFYKIANKQGYKQTGQVIKE